MIFSQPSFSVQPSGRPPLPASPFLCFADGRVLLAKQGDSYALPRFEEVQGLLPLNTVPFELARTGEVGLFSPHPFAKMDVPEGNGLQYVPTGIFRSLPYETAACIMCGWHLWSWYQNHRYCGRCAQPLSPAAEERALACPSCGQLVFPIIAPAVIVAITCGDRILLARNARSTFTHYSLIAGYVEVGETLEHTVHREVMEEVGIKLSSLRYLGDQPWGISGSHMFAFHATADDTQPIHVQQSELSEARWFDRSELAPRESTVSIAFELIERFRMGTL